MAVLVHFEVSYFLYSRRISDQEQRIESLQAEMKQIREEDDQSIQTLRSTLKYFEDKVESLKADLEARR